MFHARMPSQAPEVGGWANVHGQGMLQLQVSNQSPVTRQRGISAMHPPCLVRDSGRDVRDYRPAQFAIIHSPAAISRTPLILAPRTPKDVSFSNATNKVSAAMTNRFITPPANNSNINPQQHPTQ